jgi:hypothetical protein
MPRQVTLAAGIHNPSVGALCGSVYAQCVLRSGDRQIAAEHSVTWPRGCVPSLRAEPGVRCAAVLRGSITAMGQAARVAGFSRWTLSVA